jgi:PKD repeat protein
LGLLYVALLTALAPAAGARVTHTRLGHFVGVMPRSAASQALNRGLTSAAGRAAHLTATYENLIGRYLADVAHDSGGTSNVYSVANQYPESGHAANVYQSTFGAAITDTDPYPADSAHGNANGCPPGRLPPGDTTDPPYTFCLTDAQVQSELSAVIASHGWPTDGSAIYFVFLPSGIDECFGPGGENANSNPCADADFCAYHSSFGTTTPTPPLYGLIPFGDVVGCQSGNHPNGDPADDTISLVSHEHIETITDPLGNGWFDNMGLEIADRCASPDVFGPVLGGSAGAQPPGSPYVPGTAWDQLINTHHYWLQDEFSNADSDKCVEQRPGGTPKTASHNGSAPLTYQSGPVVGAHTTYAIFWDPPPTAIFSASTASTLLNQPITFDASQTYDPLGFGVSYSWDFGDGTTGSGQVVSHAYTTPGVHTVRLTATDTAGVSGATTKAVSIDAPPTASFTLSQNQVIAGQPVSLDGSSSTDPDGSVNAWSWSFGDGAASSGPTTTHVYTTPGTYTISLTVTDNSGSTAATSKTVTVVPALALSATIGKQKLRRLLSHRKVVFSFTANPATSGSDELLLSAKVAARLHLRAAAVTIGHVRYVVLAKGNVARPSAGGSLTLKLTRAEVAKLRRLRHLMLYVHMQLTDVYGQAGTLTIGRTFS